MNYFSKLRYLSQPKLIGHVTATSRIENKNAYPKLRSSFHDLSGCARKTFELTNWPKRHACWLLLLRFSNFFFPNFGTILTRLVTSFGLKFIWAYRLGSFPFFLGIEVLWGSTRHGTCMEQAKSCPTQSIMRLQLSSSTGPKLNNEKLYHNTVGAL